MKKCVTLCLCIIFGVCNLFSEIILRIPNIHWKYNLYYFVPIRAHVLLSILSMGVIVLILNLKTSKLVVLKTVCLISNLAFIVLWIDTMLNM